MRVYWLRVVARQRVCRRYLSVTFGARGLRVRVTQKGTKTFSLVYRNAAGKQRRYTLGTYPAMTLAEARAQARSTQIDVHAGADPQAKPASNERAPELISALLEQHLAEWARRVRKGTLDDLRSCWNRVLLTELGTLQPKQVARRDVRRIVEHLANTGHPARFELCAGRHANLLRLVRRTRHH